MSNATYSLDQLREEIELFAERFVGKDFFYFTSSKIIHDAVWGTHQFQPYELSIISLPIVQRLRQISQMGLVSYVYPSAIHTRFEHTLGVTILVERLFNYAKKEGESFLDKNDLIHIRIAALLHDIGHCMFSHTSEDLYGYMLNDIVEELFGEKDVNPKPHELFAYMIIQTKAFQRFFRWLSSKYRMSVDPNTIANYIIGLPMSEDQRYKVSFINGPFDADKIDYLYRDSQFSGVPIQLDLDRLFHEIYITDLTELNTSEEPVFDLTIGISGVACLEQIIFNKMLLYSIIYHHQKVKACDCMLKGVFEYIKEKNISLNFRDREIFFNKPTDYLWFTDIDLLTEGLRTKDDTLHKLIHNILYRRSLKRAIVISRKTIEEGEILQLVSTAANRHEKEQELREIARLILEEADNPCLPYEVWIDMPKAPEFKEAITTYVRTSKKNPNRDIKPLSEFFPVKEWTDQYDMHKLKGHIFAPEHCLDKIARAAEVVFREKYGIIFKSEAHYVS